MQVVLPEPVKPPHFTRTLFDHTKHQTMQVHQYQSKTNTHTSPHINVISPATIRSVREDKAVRLGYRGVYTTFDPAPKMRVWGEHHGWGNTTIHLLATPLPSP